MARAETSGESGHGRITRIRSIRWSHDWLADFAPRLADGRRVWHPRWGLTDAGADDGRICAAWGVRK